MMHVIELFKTYVLHLDFETLRSLVDMFGPWVYLILFGVIFCETGLVVTPFLPGDSLLFACGAVAGALGDTGALNVWLLMALLSAAAIAGDTANYWIGAYIGPRAFSGHIRFLKKEHLDRTHKFYEKYGGKTIILARFVPIVRTFAPFVAGIGAMNYTRFIIYNVVGGVAWVAMFLFAGHWFGNLEYVRRNFTLVIMAIVVISVMPMVFEAARAWLGRPKPAEDVPGK